MKLAEVLGPIRTPLWRLAAQCGVEHAVGTFGWGSSGGGRGSSHAGFRAGSDEKPWSYMSLLRLKTALESAGYKLSVIESRPPLMKAKLGHSRRGTITA